MSENFAEDEESKNAGIGIKKGTFMEEGDEQNDLMMNDPGFEQDDMKTGMPRDTLSDYNKMMAENQKRTESFSHNPRNLDEYDTIR